MNDGLRPWHDAHRLSYERLLRRLLQLPSRPLVVGLMMHSYRAVQVRVCVCLCVCAGVDGWSAGLQRGAAGAERLSGQVSYAATAMGHCWCLEVARALI